MKWSLLALAVALMAVACARSEAPAARAAEALRVAPDIAARRAQFVPETLSADISHLSEGDRQALRHLVSAARAMDEIFALQAWAGNPELAPRVAALDGPDADAARDYYRIMVGPWDRLVDHEPFLGDRPRPAGAGFYPEDMEREELEAWLAAHPEDAESFRGLHTVIRRDGDRLVAVPYSEAFREPLERAAAALRAAAAATDNASLERFLELRAAAFSSDDYYESDLAWMDLDSAIEVVIGPYETYEDTLLGYKAAFEAFLCVTDPADSARLERFKAELPALERGLPIPDEHKNPDRGSESPIRVADELLAAGDCRAGVQTLAFNLPNDERVRQAKGSKKVMLKNVLRAKYEGILKPIAERSMPAEDAALIGGEAFFQFTLHHELAHGLGPGLIEVDGRPTEVRLELRDLASALEEAKADVLSVYNIYTLVERGVMEPPILEHLPATVTAGFFRSTRFGVAEAHGLAVVIQTNYLLEKGALEVTEGERFRPVPEAFLGAFRDLATEILMIQARGDYQGAQRLVERYGTVPPAMQAVLDELTDIPVDIDPVYPLEGLE
jgi:hypothetical protein